MKGEGPNDHEPGGIEEKRCAAPATHKRQQGQGGHGDRDVSDIHLVCIEKRDQSDGGISVIPSYLARSPLASGALVQLAHPITPPTNTLFLATRTSRTQPHVTAVAHRLKQLASTW